MTEPSARVTSGTGAPESRNNQDQPVTDRQEVNTSDGGGTVTNENRTSNNVCSDGARPSKGKGLSVYFPDPKSMVLGYMEPPNPWKDVPTCDTSDLLTAYRKGCETNCVKPLIKVQQQLHAIEHNKSRYEILSFKGEKLDYKHVESLEELFSRVQFKTLDFEATHLDDESSVALFDMLEYYESTCKLNIAFNKNIGVRGWQSCARLIKKTPCLTHLDARNCELNERMMPIIGRSLKLGSSLTSLHLENTYLSGRALLILVAALKMNETLQELFLADNKLMPSDAIQLGNLLKFNHKLYLLDLRNNHLQDVGVGHLSDGLYEQNLGQGLNTLVLWNNQITYQGMSTLAKALGSTESLETLNLGHNNITNEGIHLVKEGLLKNKSLLRIGLQCTKVTCEGAVALAEYVADSRQLLRLDLRENDIKTAGLMALSLALKVNETVTKIDVDKDIKKDSGMKDYADQQRRLQVDIANFLSRNRELAIEREEEDRRRMEERARENTRLKEERERVALSNAHSVLIKPVDYIPTCTKIRRPNLLFPADCPQQTLDSPAIGGTFGDSWSKTFTDVSSSPVATSINHLISPPPGELLLSPQYCARTKAKKLFTVSKVEAGLSSPGVAGQTAGGSGALSSLPAVLPGPASPINVLSAMQPGFSQPSGEEDHLDGAGMVSDNVNSLIYQIVSEAIEMQQKSLDVDLSSSTSDIENKIDIAVSEMEQSLRVSESIEIHQQTEVKHRTMNGISDQSGQAASLLHAAPHHTKTQFTGSSNHMVHSGSIINNISVVAETYCNNNNGRAEVLSRSIVCDEGGKSGGNLVHSNHSKSAHIDPNLPDFHTSMTLNGMTRELASVLDTLELSGQSSKGGHSVPLDDATTPDEFERELDAMLANVKGGTTLGSASGLADVPPETVLQEALNHPSLF